MRIYNGTPHTITIFDISNCTFSEEKRKYFLTGEAVPVAAFSSDGMLNAYKGLSTPPDIKIPGIIIQGPVCFVEADPLPEGYDIYIVSAMYRAACIELGIDTSKLATVLNPVYRGTENPGPVGCLGLSIG